MRALAEVLHGWGAIVSGSDLDLREVNSLAGQGITLFSGHAAENLPPQAELVVHSNAVPPDNPELQRAAERGLRIRSYFQMLAELTAEGHLIAVAGTHGKSMTAALLGQILSDAGSSPTVFCGAALHGRVSGGRPGSRDLFVAEACEYRRNFLRLRPQQAAILGIEPDHFDCYPTSEDLAVAFTQFARQIPATGYLLVRHGCAASQTAARAASCRVESFGFAREADWSAEIRRGKATEERFTVTYRGRPQLDVQLPMPGRHQILNALAATVLSLQNGVAAECIRNSLARFPGLKRRFEMVGCFNGTEWIDDYAHHPTEVETTLQTVKKIYPDRRVYCVFQPHQVLRTARLLDEFALSLQNADIMLIAEIYRAREGSPQPGEITAADLARRLREFGREKGEEGRRKGEGGRGKAEGGFNGPIPTAHCPLPTAHCPLPTTHYPLPTAHCPLPTTHCPQPTAHYSLPTVYSPLHSPFAPAPSPLVPAIHGFPEIKNYLKSQLRANEVLVTLGAGNIRKVFDDFFAGI
jgi:UDP-N-acetylmuramate--alanine ligase